LRFAWISEPPFNYRKEGDLTGSDVELARRVAAELGETFDPIETAFHELLYGLKDGRWDVTTGMFVTPDRAGRAHFTRPIWALRDGLLVRAENAHGISGYRSLASTGGKLAVLKEQVQETTALQLGVDPGNISVLRDYGEAAVAVRDGNVIAFASVNRAHRQHCAAHPDEGLVCISVPGVEKAAEPGAFACRDIALRNRIDGVLDAFVGRPDHIALMRSFGFDREELTVRT
jgi:polar amino acid transport system substrate-binding protein